MEVRFLPNFHRTLDYMLPIMQNQQVSSLIELNEELENYFSNTIIPQLFVDAQLMLRKFTPPAMKQFKLSPNVLGKPLEEIRENFRYPTIIENIKTVIATGKILEKEIQTTDMQWYQMNILPYHVRKENKTNGVIITFIDITSRIRDLKEQEKLIAEHELLLDTIAHDIKNPILSLGLTIQMLKKLPVKNVEQFPVLLQNVERSLVGVKKVVNDLVDTRWQQQRYQAVEELLDIESILEDVRLTLAPQIQESNAVLEQVIEITEFSFVRRKLRSVIYNLLNNAIKYTPSGRNPRITIKTYYKDDYLVISVADNGIGISEENQERIFEKFQRVGFSNEQGSGVGLYLVNTVVAAAGGKITIESEPDKGTIFKVFLKK